MLESFWSIVRCVFHDEFTWFGSNVVSSNILITVSVSTNDDWVGPAWNKSWDVFNDDGFSENSSIKDISDCSVGRFPHLLKLELFNSFLIRCNCSTFDTYFVLFDSLCWINGNLVVSLISVLHSQIEVFDIKIQIRENVLYRNEKTFKFILQYLWYFSKWFWSFHHHQDQQLGFWP